MPTNRLEAFSDGVFSIAITLLVLDLHVPHSDGSLLDALLKQWPSYATYAVSFLVIGIIWVNHHALFACVTRVDRPLLFFNLLLLASVSLLPFPTSLVSQYLNSDRDARTAVAVYGGTASLMALSFNLIWWYVCHSRRLLADSVTPELAHATTRRFRLTLLVYIATIGIALINARASLVFHAVLALFYVLDPIKATDMSAGVENNRPGGPVNEGGISPPRP